MYIRNFCVYTNVCQTDNWDSLTPFRSMVFSNFDQAARNWILSQSSEHCCRESTSASHRSRFSSAAV